MGENKQSREGEKKNLGFISTKITNKTRETEY